MQIDKQTDTQHTEYIERLAITATQYNYIDCYGPEHLVGLLEWIQLLSMITSFMDQWFQLWGTSVGVNHFVYGMHCDNGVLSFTYHYGMYT